MMRCLVLGGGGFLGSHACDALLGHGYHVRIFEKQYVSKENVQHLTGDVEWVEGDFTNEAHLREVVQGADCIVHAIGTTLPKDSNENPVYDISSNLISTLHLLEAAKEAGVRKIIFFSSGGTVYGIPGKIPIAEDHPTDPISSYGIQKLAIEKYLFLYHYLHGLDYAVMRISNPYGERQRPIASQGAVAVFLYHVLRNEPIEIWGDGSVTRDYLHISDVARAIPLLLKYEGKEKIFNISSGQGLSLLDLIRTFEKVIGRAIEVRFTSARPFDVPVNVLDNTRARQELAWTPQIDFEQGIKRTIEFLAKV
ncbi:MAG: NAD-dependent epimerase/dehydratase family protein [Thermodesulfovibrionales bacterium]